MLKIKLATSSLVAVVTILVNNGKVSHIIQNKSTLYRKKDRRYFSGS